MIILCGTLCKNAYKIKKNNEINAKNIAKEYNY